MLRLFASSVRPLSIRCAAVYGRGSSGAVHGRRRVRSKVAQGGITAPVGVADHLRFQLLNLVGAAGLLANGAYPAAGRRPWPCGVRAVRRTGLFGV